MSIGIWQLVLVLLLVFVIFGAGKLPKVMSEIGKGIRALKENIKEDHKKE
jgi:sec-independent protein translocase protein TatA